MPPRVRLKGCWCHKGPSKFLSRATFARISEGSSTSRHMLLPLLCKFSQYKLWSLIGYVVYLMDYESPSEMYNRDVLINLIFIYYCWKKCESTICMTHYYETEITRGTTTPSLTRGTAVVSLRWHGGGSNNGSQGQWWSRQWGHRMR